MNEQRLVMLVFLLQPVPFGAWLARIPEIEAALKLGPAKLGLALLGFPAGTIAALVFGSAIAGRLGARGLILLTFPAFLGAMILPPLASDAARLFAALALTGAVMGLLELAMNLEASRVETALGRAIMSTCHGFWSLGIALGSLAGSLLAGAGLAPVGTAALLSALVAIPALAASQALPALAPDDSKQGPVFALPSGPAVPICLFILGIALTEGGLADWAGIFLRDALQVGPELVGYGFGVFAGAVAAGRFFGDFLKTRLGAARLARMSLGAALAGLLILGLSGGLMAALMAFALLGLGVAAGFPLAVSAMSALDPARAPANIAALSLAALGSFLVGPVVIGFLAESFGIRAALMALAPALLGSLVFAASLGSSPR